MIELRDLEAGYGPLHVLFGVTTSYAPKLITSIVGPNGSGKSTLLKTIFGFTKVFSGKVIFDGIDITGKPSHQVARLGIAYLPQTDNVFANLTVRENLMMATYGLDKELARERVEEAMASFPVLERYWRRKAGTLSGGERQMLAMAVALVRRPKVMLFDEPTANLAPKVAKAVLDKIAELRDEYGITVLLVEQNALRALEYGDRAQLLVSGRLVFDGPARELLESRELGRLYLGLKG
ncbi:MAG: ABC transporter ATP-binding protein [Aigarchaeota archaeon]|nr:ABC transporter ATP-binding protein [Aigarchaeota archaeon]MCX8202734.1 ABC transporter ATP-binding protein [Nitrososphaeria archaeon]MDW8043722.1 ABC transporter ATP-binding protein [Nitrososphaerota archaeon]